MALVAAVPASAGQPGSASPIGRWFTGRDAGVIQIEPCGENLCGRIVGLTLDHPTDPMPTDYRGRPQCGLIIIHDARRTGADEWTGRISDPRNGRSYNARLRVDPYGRLQVRGYVGLPLFGETLIWSPYTGRLGEHCELIPLLRREAGAGN
jgi:uncharacterized protein (DUF2147 family)